MAKMIMSSLNTVFVLFTVLSPSFSLCCPQYQKEALLHFKFLVLGNFSSSDNKFLRGLETWNSSTDCCQEWERITCSTISRQVTDLFLLNVSPLPRTSNNILTPIFHIRTLESLDISYNNIQGDISGIGFANLTQLVKLAMRDNMFNGYIPPQLFSLRYLETLNLSNNFIEGTLGGHNMGWSLDGEIGNLTKLRKLYLANNKISGAIPSSICHLKELQYLDFHSNFFSMEIPAQIGNLSNIISLNFLDNHLTRKIPPSMQKMEHLEVLQLEDNLLSAEIPAWLFGFWNLTVLNLGGNKLVLKNVSIIPNTAQLVVLNLRSCSVSGRVPVFLSNLTSLLTFDLSQNNLVGNMPDWITRRNLRTLDLSDNMLSGSLSHLLFQSNSSFLRLDLSRNHFSGQLPDNIGESNYISEIILSNNDFFGPTPKSISNTSLLSMLDLSNNRLSGDEFPFFNTLFLDLSFNKFSGAIPESFCADIMVIVLNHNDFSRVQPQTLRNLSNLALLDLHDNNITGQLPTSISQISSLRVLDLKNNSFQGPIPKGLSNLTRLQILDLSNNFFSGQVPHSLVKLSGMINPNPKVPSLFFYYYRYGAGVPVVGYPDLQVFWKNFVRDLPSQHLLLYTFLDLSNNQLSGQIPDDLGYLKSLKALNLSHNKLSGRIPDALGYMDNLESLDLSYNCLSGQIPETFGHLLQLTVLELSNNKLVGRIPNGPQMDRLNNEDSFANNSGLCGMQIQVACDQQGLPKTKTEQEESEDEGRGARFSWVMAGIGFSAGFLSTVLVLYVIGYFDAVPRRGRRFRVRRRA